MKAARNIIHLARYGETLKRVNRTGWALAGVSCGRSESVGEHSYGTAILSFLISKELIESNWIVDLNKVTSMALIHDLPEALTSDLPQSIAKIGDNDLMKDKKKVERVAISEMAKAKSWLIDLWDEMEKSKSIESRIVLGADMLDMLIHALSLETSGVSPKVLNQFFLSSHEKLDSIEIPLIASIFWELYREHLDNADTMRIQLDEISRQ
ncbi:MAG: HD family hydrolase [Candidatus Thorarchaeota archaeon]